MRVRYIGPDQGVDSLTDKKIYDVVDVRPPWIRIIDDSNEDYVYPIKEPHLLDSKVAGKFEIVEDDDFETLKKAFREVL